MMYEMVKDLFYFIVVFLIIIIMYGVMSTVIRYPNLKSSTEIFIKIIREPYFNIYAELFLDEFDKEIERPCNKTVFSDNPCPETSTVALVLFAFFLLFGNVLMLNLLIARFTFSVTKIWDEANLNQSYLMVDIVKEYSYKTYFFPPISLIFLILQIFFEGLRSYPYKPVKKEPAINDFEIRGQVSYLIKGKKIKIKFFLVELFLKMLYFLIYL